jgi:hypothetical protein
MDPAVRRGVRRYVTLAANCGNWTSQDTYSMGPSDGEESAFSGWGSRPWSTPAHLHCFQVDFQTPVVAVPDSGRLAFYLVDSWTPGGGIGAADTAGQNAATSAGLTGSFRALLATSTDSAASRFTDGPTWVRRDGVRLAATAADVLAGNLEAATSRRRSACKRAARTARPAGTSSPVALHRRSRDWASTSGSAQ